MRRADISVSVCQEFEEYYHYSHPVHGVTLCGWVDVQHQEHSIRDHPVTCPSCRAIVSFCKTCSGPFEEPGLEGGRRERSDTRGP